MRVVTIPNDVQCLIDIRGMTPISAWRTYLGITQSEMADRIGMTVPQYRRVDTADWPRRVSIIRAAEAMGIEPEQVLVLHLYVPGSQPLLVVSEK